ncbi:MAG: prepilin-type N-terminal cleavage/methylation domain-containing protein [Pseudomonadota bacterium]
MIFQTTQDRNGYRGFTLIELILVLIISAIAGSMLVPMLGRSLYNSSISVINTQNHARLIQDMELVSAKYQSLKIHWHLNPINNFKDRIEDTLFTASETQHACSYISFDSEHKEIQRDGGSDILKVTLTRNNETLTAFFTQ